MQPTITSTARQFPGQWRRWLLLEDESESLLDALAPSLNLVQKIAIAIAFIAIVALLARARFFLPDNPVPITFQTFGILITGGVLGWRWGILSGVGYYLVGMAGLPVFQGGGNGWGAVTGATGGYLLGFILATALVGYLSQHGWNRSRSIWPMLLGGLILYVPALIWLSVRDYGWPADGELFSAAMYPFIPGDLVKLMLAALLVGAAWNYLSYRNGSGVSPRSDERIGRLEFLGIQTMVGFVSYLAYLFASLATDSSAGMALIAIVVSLVVMGLALYLSIPAYAKRLRDFGQPGNRAWLSLIPGVGFVLLLVCLIKPGHGDIAREIPGSSI